MADEKIKYRRNLTTTQNDRTTTTEREPEYSTSVTHEVNGFYNPDGTPNEAAQADFDAQRRAAAAAYGVDPSTGRVQPKFVTDILGVDPDEMRQKREEEEELNRRKQRESGLYSALSVLGDMVTTAAGGNVWLRQPDQRAKAAHEANMALDREQQAEDIANAGKLRGAEQEYAKAVQKIRDSVAKAYSTKVTRTQKEGGKSTSKTTGGGSNTTGYVEGKGASDGNGGGIGSGGGKGMYINVKLKDGTERRYNVSKNQFEAATSLLRRHYDDILHRGNADNATEQEIKAAEDLTRDLVRVGALEQNTDEMTGKIQYKFKDNMLLQSGEYFQLTPAIRTRLENETGGQIRFVTGQNSKPQGWGVVPENNDYDF